MKISLLGETLDALCAMTYWRARGRGLCCSGDDLGELEMVDYQLDNTEWHLAELQSLLAQGVTPTAVLSERLFNGEYPVWTCPVSGDAWTVDCEHPHGEPRAYHATLHGDW